MHACTYVHPMHVWKSSRSEEGIGASEAGVTDNREPSCSCWKQSPGPLHEQQILLSIEPGPSLKVLLFLFNMYKSLPVLSMCVCLMCAVPLEIPLVLELQMV